MECNHKWKLVAKNFYKNGNIRSWVFQCNECGNRETMNKRDAAFALCGRKDNDM